MGQSDLPVEATAIFPPSEVPKSPPSSYAQATIYYMDPDGGAINTASPALPGASGPSISTVETDEFGNVIRELSPQNRLRSLEAGTGSVARSHELRPSASITAMGSRCVKNGAQLIRCAWNRGNRHRLACTSRSNTTKVPRHRRRNPPAYLPTKKTVGAAIVGQKEDADQRVIETRYDWDAEKADGNGRRPLGGSTSAPIPPTIPRQGFRLNGACRRIPVAVMPIPPSSSTTRAANREVARTTLDTRGFFAR